MSTTTDLETLGQRNVSNSSRMTAALTSQLQEISRCRGVIEQQDAEIKQLRAALKAAGRPDVDEQLARLKRESRDLAARLSSTEAALAAANASVEGLSKQLQELHEANSRPTSTRFASLDEAIAAYDKLAAAQIVLQGELDFCRAQNAVLARDHDKLRATAAADAAAAEHEHAILTSENEFLKTFNVQLDAVRQERDELRGALARALAHQQAIDAQLAEVFGKPYAAAAESTTAPGAPPLAAGTAAADDAARGAAVPSAAPTGDASADFGSALMSLASAPGSALGHLGAAAFGMRRVLGLGGVLGAAQLGPDADLDDDEEAAAAATGEDGTEEEEEGEAAAPPSSSPAQAPPSLARAPSAPRAAGPPPPAVPAPPASDPPVSSRVRPSSPEPASAPAPARSRFAGLAAAAAGGQEVSPTARSHAPATAASPGVPLARQPSQLPPQALPPLQPPPPPTAVLPAPTAADVADRNRIAAAAAAGRADRTAARKEGPFAVVDNELAATPLLRDLLEPSRFVRVSATKFAPLAMMQHRVFLILAMHIEPGQPDDAPERDLSGLLNLGSLSQQKVLVLERAGLLDSLRRAAASTAARPAPADGAPRPHPATPAISGILSSADWAAALAAAFPNPALRGAKVLSLVTELETDVSDLVLDKDTYSRGYAGLATTGSAHVYAEQLQTALFRWVAAEACDLSVDEVTADGPIAVGRGVAKQGLAYGPLTLQLIKDWSLAVWSVLCAYPEWSAPGAADKIITLGSWQSFFLAHSRRASPLEHFHLLHALVETSECPRAFLHGAVGGGAAASADTCSVM